AHQTDPTLQTDPASQTDPTSPTSSAPPPPGASLTPMGETVRHMPLHPRLARMLVEAGGPREIVQVCALLSERHFIPARTASTSSDLLSALDDWRNMPVHVQRVASVIADSTLRIADRVWR